MQSDQNWRIIYATPIAIQLIFMPFVIFSYKHPSLINLLKSTDLQDQEYLKHQLKKVYVIENEKVHVLAKTLRGQINDTKDHTPILEALTSKKERRKRAESAQKLYDERYSRRIYVGKMQQLMQLLG